MQKDQPSGKKIKGKKKQKTIMPLVGFESTSSSSFNIPPNVIDQR
jgi:hypothetical protein